MNKVQLDQKIGVTKTSIGERALARLLSADVLDDPKTQAEQDLLTDTFHTYHSHKPTMKEVLPLDRQVNKHLLDWMMSARNFEESRQSTTGNIAPALVTSSLAWHMMRTDDALSDALDKQEQAERASAVAMRNMQEATKETNPEKRRDKEDAAQVRSNQAERLVEEAIESIDKLKGSPQGQAVMNAITEDAKEEGEKVQAVMRGWGAEAGSMTTTDVDSIIEYSKATPMGDKLKEIAKLAGRLKGLALNTMQDERKGVIGPATLPDKTKDVERLFQSEFIQMSQKAPRALRAVKIAEFIDKGGLLGWIPAARRKEYGDVEFYIDGSGSMSGNPEIVAKSVCLGIAKAMREDRGSTVDRWYRLSMFSTSRQGFIRCEHDSTWLTHMQWAAKMPNGGTDFNYVLKSAIEKITERHRKGKKGTDLILITDGIAKMSQEVIDDWKKLVSDTGARMFLIAVNIPDHYITQFEGLADFIFKVGSHGTLEMVADDLTEKISQFIVQNERR